jgi:hypothetical protein
MVLCIVCYYYLATFAYIAAIHPFVKDKYLMEKQEMGSNAAAVSSSSKGSIKVDVDDGNIYAGQSTMLRVIKFIQRNDPKVCYYIKGSKKVVILLESVIILLESVEL